MGRLSHEKIDQLRAWGREGCMSYSEAARRLPTSIITATKHMKAGEAERGHQPTATVEPPWKKPAVSSEAGPAGDPEFDAQVLEARKELLPFALKRTLDRDKAEELIAQTVLRLYEKKDQFIPGTNFIAWAATILKNLHLDSFRRAKNHVPLQMEVEGKNGEGEVERVHENLTTQPLQESGLVAQDMKREFDTLPRKTQRLMLGAANDESYDTLAKAEGVAVGTVKSRISRGRAVVNQSDARVIPAVSRENRTAVDFIIARLRSERTRIDQAIASLEQLRPMLIEAD